MGLEFTIRDPESQPGALFNFYMGLQENVKLDMWLAIYFCWTKGLQNMSGIAIIVGENSSLQGVLR